MTGIIHAIHISKTGTSRHLKPDEYNFRPKKNGFVWLHFDRNNLDTETFIHDDQETDIAASRTLLADDSRPRTILDNENILLNLRGVNLSEGSKPEDMVGIRFYVQSDRILSIEKRPLKATSHMAKYILSLKSSMTPGGFIAAYSQAILEHMGPIVTDLNEEVDALEENIDEVHAAQSRAVLADLRRQAILLRRYIAPQRDALNSLSQQNLNYITADDRLRIRDSADQTTRITEELEAIRERCAIVKDQLTDMRAEEMNRNMMILSVVAAIFLPLGLISGMFGINVGGMPWTESIHGFWIVTASVIVIAIVQLIVFKILKWI
ncbi:zinc transporter ZntB [Hellea balneolensis]|uniref:zinc transporter ZntB n=1 Tax=Hellea balneolensis TaxID=287478 RepID=UPI0004002C0F|nr:zinc transporter ZntB [Hellea balneolensis]